MAKRIVWIPLEPTSLKWTALAVFRVYRIRLANAANQAISVPRICGLDRQGLLYIGRSALSSSVRRTIANRLSEFLGGNHSGGKTYAGARRMLSAKFKGYHLEAQALPMPDLKIKSCEKNLLGAYFRSFGELPPLNSHKA